MAFDDTPNYIVALLAEGVGRNKDEKGNTVPVKMSPSSRRAWVEISSHLSGCTAVFASPSSRRAWVEIAPPSCPDRDY